MTESPTQPAPTAPPASAYPRYRPWVHGLALLLVLMTFILIAMGGTVTSHEAGMAVPEAFFTGPYWSLIAPLEYWYYDANRFLEHSHRLQGYLVGFVTIALMISLLKTQGPRTWVKVLGVGLLLYVIGQGVLGILRVALNEQSWVTGSAFAAVHGVTGQLLLCLTVLAAAATGKFWMNRPPEVHPEVTPSEAVSNDETIGTANQHDEAPDDRVSVVGRHRRSLRVLPIVLLIALFGQLALGAAVRHSKSALAIPDWPMHYGQLVPPMSQAEIDDAVAAIPVDQRAERFAMPRMDQQGNLQPGGYADWQVHLHFTHRVTGYLLFGFGLFFVAWLWRCYPGQPRVLLPATLFGGLLILQVLLGIMTVLTGEHATMATTHQSVGALLMASATWLTIRLHLVPEHDVRPAHVPVAAGDAMTEVFRQSAGRDDETDASPSANTASSRSAAKPSQPQTQNQTVKV